MTLESFVKINNGKKIDYDKCYGAQCVDLFRQYCVDVLEIPEHTGGVVGAKDLYLNYPSMEKEKKYFNRFTQWQIDLKTGDVLVWGASKTNQYGHVAIYLGYIGNSILVFEQDGFKQDGAKINVRSMENILGILRRK